MRFFRRKFFKPTARAMPFVLVAMMLFVMVPGGAASAQLPALNPNDVRAAVRQMGMDSLATVIVNDPAGLTTYERLQTPVADPNTNPPTPAPPASLVAYAQSQGITVQRAAMRVLGKAFFWDQQAGSDGQACASCHFHAGSDIRTTNTLNPTTRNTNPAEQTVWGMTNSNQQGGPNYTLTQSDFPFHELADPLETNYEKRDVLFDTDDAVGSIGAFHATYGGSPAPNYGVANAAGTYDTALAPVTDQFTVDTNGPAAGGNRNVRSNGPRQAGPTINAMFTFNNFWDGRADNSFNGLNMHGIKDLNSFSWLNGGGVLIRDVAAGVGDASLASQAQAPPNSETSDEMAFSGRTMQDLGRKLLRLTGPGSGAVATASVNTTGSIVSIAVNNGGSNYIHGASVSIVGGGGAGATATATVNGAGVVTAITVTAPGGGFVTTPAVTINSIGLDTAAQADGIAGIQPAIIPLGAQLVSPTDSVLGTFKNPAGTNGGRGINLSYVNLIQWAFNPVYWDSTGPADVNGAPTTLRTTNGVHLMEQNLTTFWGLGIQFYEMLLRSDQTPYDFFMSGNNGAFDPAGYTGTPGYSQEAQDVMRGLLTYVATENTAQQVNPVFNNINSGACQLCHSGKELTEAAAPNVKVKLFVATDMTVKMDHNRELAIVPPSANFDVGFTNVGTRPSREDLGLGGTVPQLGSSIPLSLTRQGIMGYVWALLMLPLFPAEPNPHRGSNLDGAFKIPHPRNVELNGPYFHNGGTLTLKQVVEFYARHGDFADLNDPNIDVGLAMVTNIGHADADLLVKFMLKLTDERVRWEMAPFDHPQIFLPNGHAAGLPTANPTLGSAFAADNFLVLPAVGLNGRHDLTGANYPDNPAPLPNFLNISSTPVAGPNNDHFDP